ncbi:MAG: SDR family NAD(P)-dependent oxidoreductase [Xanthomonadaceae bacterium]|nr:SDR family NAD(P)-dependent oxidoreductase [Xanthomonadaceae bacterium]
MTQDHDGKSVIVTGAARRIGAVIAEALHHRGLKVLIHCRNSVSEARALVARLNADRAGSASLIQAELADNQAPVRIVDAALDAFGRLDVLVNNASSFYPTPVESASQQQWDALIDSNQRAPFWLSLAAAKAMAGRAGSIVNLVDIHGIVPLKDHPIYSQAKAGLIMQTRAPM